MSPAAFITFSGLRQRNTVVGVAHGLVHAANLAGEALRDGHARSVVLGAVDAQARRQALDGVVERTLADAQVALGGERGDVGIDGGGHCRLLKSN